MHITYQNRQNKWQCEWWQWRWRCNADEVQCQFNVIICNVYDWRQNIKAATNFQYKHIRICYLKQESKSKTYHSHHEDSVPLSSGGRPHLRLYQAIRYLHRGLRPLPRHPPQSQLRGPRLQVQAHRVSHPGRVRQAINVCTIFQITP